MAKLEISPEYEFEFIGLCTCGNVAYTLMSLLKSQDKITTLSNPIPVCDECLQKYTVDKIARRITE